MTYELVNLVSGNSLDSFETEAAALSVFEEFRATDAEFANELVLVAFDDDGEAVDATPASVRAAQPA